MKRNPNNNNNHSLRHILCPVWRMPMSMVFFPPAGAERAILSYMARVRCLCSAAFRCLSMSMSSRVLVRRANFSSRLAKSRTKKSLSVEPV